MKTPFSAIHSLKSITMKSLKAIPVIFILGVATSSIAHASIAQASEVKYPYFTCSHIPSTGTYYVIAHSQNATYPVTPTYGTSDENRERKCISFANQLTTYFEKYSAKEVHFRCEANDVDACPALYKNSNSCPSNENKLTLIGQYDNKDPISCDFYANRLNKMKHEFLEQN